ncbi:MAG: ribosome silencing factor [Magnetococcales bacterium]|nr:ribosome silencing factor [Magnetococcales bacterium]
MTKPDEETLALSLKAHLEDKKAVEIILLDLRGRASFADFFVVATGTSHTHVSALAAEVDRFCHERGIRVLGVAGLPEATWVLVDAGDIVVHLFQQEARSFYELEKLWHQPPAKPGKPEKPAGQPSPDPSPPAEQRTGPEKPKKLDKPTKSGKPGKLDKSDKPGKVAKRAKTDKVKHP